MTRKKLGVVKEEVDFLLSFLYTGGMLILEAEKRDKTVGLEKLR